MKFTLLFAVIIFGLCFIYDKCGPDKPQYSLRETEYMKRMAVKDGYRYGWKIICNPFGRTWFSGHWDNRDYTLNHAIAVKHGVLMATQKNCDIKKPAKVNLETF